MRTTITITAQASNKPQITKPTTKPAKCKKNKKI